MLQIINGKKQFGDRVLFEHLNIKFNEHGFFIIVGSSGCGKSTLLSILNGFESLDEGMIVFNNKKLSSSKDFFDFRKKYCSFIFQDYGLINNYNIYQNVALPLMIRNKKNKKQIVVNQLKKLNLNKKLTDKCQNLSGGEKQRIAIARSIISESDIVFCDEPSGSLDEKNSKNVFNILKQISKEKLVICVTHDKNLANAYGDIIFDFNQMKLVKNNCESYKKIKSPKKTFKPINLKDRFLLSLSSIFYRKYRTLLSIISTSIVAIFLLITICLSNGINMTLKDNLTSYLNYNQINVGKNESSPLGDSGFSLIRMKRPSRNELIEAIQGYHYKLCYDYSYLFQGCDFFVDGIEKDFNFKPIDALGINKYGRYINTIKRMSINQIIVNSQCKLKINQRIELKINQTIETFDHYFNRAIDSFILELNLMVIDVVDEFEFMGVPTIYYSYSAFQRFLMTTEIKNASYLLKKPLTYFDRFSSLSSDSEEISNYNFILYIDDYQVSEVVRLLETKGYSITSFPLENGKSLLDILDSIQLVLIIFTSLSTLIVVLLMGMIMYSLVVDRKREIGIFSVIGISSSEINSMFSTDAGIICLISSFLCVTGIDIIIDGINYLIMKKIKIVNLLSLPVHKEMFKMMFLFLSIVLGAILGYIPSFIASKRKVNNNLRDI